MKSKTLIIILALQFSLVFADINSIYPVYKDRSFENNLKYEGLYTDEIYKLIGDSLQNDDIDI